MDMVRFREDIKKRSREYIVREWVISRYNGWISE